MNDNIIVIDQEQHDLIGAMLTEEYLTLRRNLLDDTQTNLRLTLDNAFGHFVLEHLDEILIVSQGNVHIQTVDLMLPSDQVVEEAVEEDDVHQADLLIREYEYNERWNKVGQIFENLGGLQELSVCTIPNHRDAPQLTPDRGALQTCLASAYQIRKLRIACPVSTTHLEAIANGIRWHPNLEIFLLDEVVEDDGGGMEALVQALITLPNLHTYDALTVHDQPIRQPMCSPESLHRLLQLATLRTVNLGPVVLEEAHGRAIASALSNGGGSHITALNLVSAEFVGSASAFVAQGLVTNTTVEKLEVDQSTLCAGFYVSLAAALDVNTTLHSLYLIAPVAGEDQPDHPGEWLIPLLKALKVNTMLYTLSMYGINKLLLDNNGVCQMLCTCLEHNTGLLALAFTEDPALASVWHRIAPFLRVNDTLKFLLVEGNFVGFTWVGSLAALQDNESLERLAMRRAVNEERVTVSKRASAIGLLSENTTLKDLYFGRPNEGMDDGELDRGHGDNEESSEETRSDQEEEEDRLIAAARRNYGLECIDVPPTFRRINELRTIGKLNHAGRRYLVEDARRGRGVAVLSKVSDDLDAVLIHLLENPLLCDRSTWEDTTRSERKRSSLLLS